MNKPKAFRFCALIIGTGLASAGVVNSWALAESGLPGGEGIGVFTAVHGKVTVTHPAASEMIPVVINEEVLYRDIIETQNESRTKALLNDDSVLTIGEHSRVEITEHVYNPDQNLRRVVVRLAKGTVRALVSKVFTGSGSKFEVHTPTAVAAARGTYFVVWVEGGISGIVNIGNSGRVDFTSGERTVTVHPHQFATAPSGGAPGLPQVLAGNAPPGVLAAMAGTEFAEQPQTETPEQVIQELGSSVPSSLTHGKRGRGKENAPGQTGQTPAELLGTAPGQTGATPSQGAQPPGLTGATPGQTPGGTPGYGRGLGNGPNSTPPGPPIVISAGGQPIPGLAGSGRGRGGGGNPCGGPCGGPPPGVGGGPPPGKGPGGKP